MTPNKSKNKSSDRSASAGNTKSPRKSTNKRPARKNKTGGVKKRRAPHGRSFLSNIFSQRFSWWKGTYSYLLLLILILAGTGYIVYLDGLVRERFEGQLWSVPSKVFARSLVLTPEMTLDPDGFEYELSAMAYEKTTAFPQRAGQYRRWQNTFELITREFSDSHTQEPSRAIRLNFENQRLQTLQELFSSEPLPSVRLDPALIATIYPDKAEDRVLLRLSEMPERLVKTLIAVEDRSFYQHWGVNPLAIMRAIVVNLQAGEHRQGGSTLTQQLVKNLFLSSERSYGRKIKEAIMSVLLEWHYDKDSILEAYLNEVYLGQAKSASIHGFELGSQFYFSKSLDKLSTEQIALLIGMIKGPSYYNPRNHPKRALERRNVVLDVMLEQGVISNLHHQQYRERGLGVVANIPHTGVRHPAFVDLIKRQLRSRFTEDVLKHEGLLIYSTLDPQVQRAAEQAVTDTLDAIQQSAHDTPLQSAVIVSDVKTAEVLALVGDRQTEFQGFNRALDASRQIGSLIKPAIYLAALNSPHGFHQATVLSDEILRLQSRNGDIWEPQNYDGEFRGSVLLRDALVHSYNVPSVRLGLKLGLAEIVNTLRNLGLQKDVPVYPSMLLGAFELTPFEVAGIYQTIAADGQQLGLHAIRTVLSNAEKPLVHFAEEHEYTINKDVMFLLKSMMHDVTRAGTAKSLAQFPFKVAGKTGTTDDTRDSWFAGFSADKLGVVWVGNDDNLTTGLTGASGALKVWTSLFQHISFDDLDLSLPDTLDSYRVDKRSGLLAGFGCNNTIELVFLKNVRPVDYADCW